MACIKLLHEQCINALGRLGDPNLSIELPLVQGKAPGIRDLQIAHFPPKGIHPDEVSIGYTFEMSGDRKFRIEMMPNLVSHCDGQVVVVGFWSHSQSYGNEDRNVEGIDLQGEVPVHDKYFVVSYSLNGKRGTIVIMKTLYAVIERHFA